MSQGGRDSTFNDLLPSSVGKHGEGAGRASNGADGPRDAPRSGGQHDRQDSQGRGFPMPQGRPQALPADNFTDYPKRGEPMAMRPQSARSESTEGDGHERGAQGHDSGDQKGMAQSPGLEFFLGQMFEKLTDNFAKSMEEVTGRLDRLEKTCDRLGDAVDNVRHAETQREEASNEALVNMESAVREVMRGVQLLRDKQELMESQQELAKAATAAALAATKPQQDLIPDMAPPPAAQPAPAPPQA
eukprot:CAMPEP_0182912580 /NCGR_PEP_ID=MMETSP0034_2-20130328/37587_1 /TAXON_ID=156128 /ORGANISM="Nephroselmis pyriformis, Strain CCMP717" /LENGTH=243 /DNA_ID=CAMNT_0025049255 /DNA_START=77 /DNA_END=805 /DNA_ORIENTATION=+